MTFDELQITLTDALASGKIGTPVAARVHLQFPDADADLAAALATVAATFEPILDGLLTTLRCRQGSDLNQWNLLLQSEKGRTLFVTLGRASVPAATLNLLVIGNHGVIRLEGGEDFEPGGFGDPSQQERQRWAEAVETANRRQLLVSLKSVTL